MRFIRLLGIAAAVMAIIACGSDGDDQAVVVSGLFEFDLPTGWSVIVPGNRDDDLTPLVAVGKREDKREDSISVALFDGRQWETPEAAAADLEERSRVSLDFDTFERDGVKHHRAEVEAEASEPGKPDAGVAVLDVLSAPSSSGEPWVVLFCVAGPGQLDAVRDACDRIVGGLRPWTPG